MSSEPLDVVEISRRLGGLSIPFELLYLPEVTSTNAVISAMDPSEIRHGLIVATDYQSAGRGRLSRSWIAPPASSVLLSVALQLPPGIPPTDAAILGALAVVDAVRETIGREPRLKWPNDVLLSDRKVGGILTEQVSRGATPYAIIGIGINANVDRADLPTLGRAATSLSCELDAEVSREDLITHLLRALDMWYCCVQRDPNGVHREWSNRLETVGQWTRIIDGSGTWYGMATEVRRDGGLVVRRENGESRTVYAADVSVRPFEDFTSSN
jgi:BirA family biotin operon repressor/biotin-[acetyl-CoA-carboxylase] ligase